MASVMAMEMEQNSFTERIINRTWGELDIQLKSESSDLIYFLDQY